MSVVTHPATVAPSADHTQTDSARRAGGPEDQALYACACGNAFTAPVSTSVDCPRCGSGQAW